MTSDYSDKLLGADNSFKDLIRTSENGLRHRYAKQTRSLEIDDKLQLGGLLNREFRRFGTMEYPSGQIADLAVTIR